MGRSRQFNRFKGCLTDIIGVGNYGSLKLFIIISLGIIYFLSLFTIGDLVSIVL